MKKASLLILEKNNKILFAKRSPKKISLPNKWSLPSEKIEPKETPTQAAKRCAKEELGLGINPKPFRKIYFKNNKEEKVLYFFKAKIDRTPDIKQKHEIVELKEMNFEEFFKQYLDNEIGHGLRYLRKELDILIT